MKISKEVKIALTAIVAIAILFFGLNFLKGHVVLSDDNSYKITFQDIQGLSTSSPIYADGYKVGVVRSIDYDYENHKGITVTVDLDKNLRVPKGSKAEVTSDLMGNVKVNLLLANNPRERIEIGGTIEGVVNEGAMGEAKKMIPVIEKMLPKVDSILTAVNALLNSPALANTLNNVDGMTADLRTSAAELKGMMAQLNSQMPGLMAKADNVLANASTTLSNTSELTGKLAKVDVEGTMAQVNQVLDNVNTLSQKLNSTEGTIGKFMNDPTLYNNMSTLMSTADSLVTDLKSHPKRYVHFSIFGKKDK